LDAFAAERQSLCLTTVFLARTGLRCQIGNMSAPLVDFSHLTPDQRLELIGELWDSLDPTGLLHVPGKSGIA